MGSRGQKRTQRVFGKVAGARKGGGRVARKTGRAQRMARSSEVYRMTPEMLKPKSRPRRKK